MTVLRSFGIVACLLGILAGYAVVYLVGAPSLTYTGFFAYIGIPIHSWLVTGGVITLTISLVGLIAIIGSGLAKSRKVRIFFNSLGAAVLLVVLAFGFLGYDTYRSSLEADRERERYREMTLEYAERGNVIAQQELADLYWQDWRYASRRNPTTCPEALHWYQRAAYQVYGEAIYKVALAYKQCAPGFTKNRAVLTYIWDTLAIEYSGRARSSYRNGWRPKNALEGVFSDDVIDTVLSDAEILIEHARIAFEDANMSPAKRQVAIETAFHALLPSSGTIYEPLPSR